MQVRGVDARGRAPFWVADIVDGSVHAIEPVAELADALEAPAADVIAVDVALGHEDPEGTGDGLRACDRAARELLGEASDRVFVLPPPAVFETDTYHDALEACDEHGWPKLEPPLWFAQDRLRWLNEQAGADDRLVEVHPEISFTYMDPDRDPCGRYGDSWAALEERLERLRAQGLHPEHVPEDDDQDPRAALDACAAAWTAGRLARGLADQLPTPPPTDPRTGREVALHA